MISSTDLAKLRIHRTIFHDVPKRPRGTELQPVLADLETKVDARREDMLRRRLVQVLGSKSAYPIEFLRGTSSQVPPEVRKFTATQHTAEQFVEMSKRLAVFLFEQHTGAISAGLLCIIEVTSASRVGLALLKLEREEGAELVFREEHGKRVVDMSVLDNLILTDGTRLFKAGLFLRDGVGDDDFLAAACDNQRTVVTSDDVARFWLRYLGCRVTEEPRVSTQKWYETSIQFVNDCIDDPVIKNNLYEHIHSELKSNRKTLSPKRFMEDYLDKTQQAEYFQFLAGHGVSTHQFDKDLSDIKGHLRKRAYHTAKGVSVTAPADEVNLVEVEADEIIVHDRLLTIERK